MMELDNYNSYKENKINPIIKKDDWLAFLNSDDSDDDDENNNNNNHMEREKNNSLNEIEQNNYSNNNDNIFDLNQFFHFNGIEEEDIKNKKASKFLETIILSPNQVQRNNDIEFNASSLHTNLNDEEKKYIKDNDNNCNTNIINQ